MTWSTKSFLRATDDQHFFDGSNARWIGLLSLSNALLCGAERGQAPGGCPGGDDRAWNCLIYKRGGKRKGKKGKGGR